MNILIIGGTRFQGRYLVRYLLDAGHAITIFNRGTHKLDLRGMLTEIRGNRNNRVDLARLSCQEYDACIDTCAYFPEQVTLTAKIIKTKRYCLISTVYTYEDQDALLSENSPLIRTPDGCSHELTPDNYGGLKVLCEEEAKANFGEASLIIRPSIIVGIGDHTERLLFWLRLAAIHGKRLDIIDRKPVVQLIDVRDLASFTATCIGEHRQGAVNVCGEPIGLSNLLDSIEAVTGRRLARMSLDARDLPNFKLAKLPFCEEGHLARHSTALARRWGFTARPLKNSIVDIHTDYLINGYRLNHYRDIEADILSLFE